MSWNAFHEVKTLSKGTKHSTVGDFVIKLQHFIGFLALNMLIYAILCKLGWSEVSHFLFIY